MDAFKEAQIELNKSYKFVAQIIDEEIDEVIAEVSGLSEESLMEEMGKMKWSNAIDSYERDLILEKEIDVD